MVEFAGKTVLCSLKRQTKMHRGRPKNQTKGKNMQMTLDFSSPFTHLTSLKHTTGK